ncbi:MAG TPA: formate dehydrogenase accessory sulfurtransferase FdhD [Actinomycetota bacterium]|nr:formate dehydrogenase accessory sulfurtransferase FdhD [Actinomycetota bacterium]
MSEPATRRAVERARAVVVRGGRAAERVDRVAGEEPLEIRAAGPGQTPVQVAVTMRTPGHDFDLAAGFLFTEGLVQPGDVARVSYCDDLDDDQRFNVVTVRTRARFDAESLTRHFFATSSCGVCGKASLDAVAVACERVGPGPRVARSVLERLPDALRAAQRVFEATGGLHAAGLFDARGDAVVVREDVGRHNAVDKAIGALLLRDGTPLPDALLMVSGRVSFEVVQKAAVAGVPVVCAVSAPTSLAVDASRRFGMTLVGFLRGDGFNVYSAPERVDLDA